MRRWPSMPETGRKNMENQIPNTSGRIRRSSGISFRDAGMVLVLILLAAFIQTRNSQFLTVENLTDMIVNTAILATLAIGMMMVMITGGIDLSIGANIALSGMVAAQFIKNSPDAHPIVSILIGMAIGLACGLIVGIVVGCGKVLPLIASLGMMNVYRGITYMVSGGAWVSAYQMPASFKAVATGRLLGINNLVLIAILFYVGAFYFLGYSRTGRMIYAVGSNYEASRISGISSDRIIVMVYAILGFISGLCGVLWVSKFASAQGDTAQGYEMNVIAACVLGGVSVVGGSGKVPGVLLGALLIGVLKNALPLLKVSPFFQNAIYGLIILFAIILNTMVKRIVDRNNLLRRNI